MSEMLYQVEMIPADDKIFIHDVMLGTSHMDTAGPAQGVIIRATGIRGEGTEETVTLSLSPQVASELAHGLMAMLAEVERDRRNVQ